MEFILIQGIVRSNLRPDRKFYDGIGIKSKYPNRGFLSCNECGKLTNHYPSISGMYRKYHKLAFIDQEDIKLFKGEIHFNEEENIYFARCYDETIKDD